MKWQTDRGEHWRQRKGERERAQMERESLRERERERERESTDGKGVSKRERESTDGKGVERERERAKVGKIVERQTDRQRESEREREQRWKESLNTASSFLSLIACSMDWCKWVVLAHAFENLPLTLQMTPHSLKQNEFSFLIAFNLSLYLTCWKLPQIFRTKFFEFDQKPVCKNCYDKFPGELKKRLKKAYEEQGKKWKQGQTTRTDITL